jgi:hypothetical protein
MSVSLESDSSVRSTLRKCSLYIMAEKWIVISSSPQSICSVFCNGIWSNCMEDFIDALCRYNTRWDLLSIPQLHLFRSCHSEFIIDHDSQSLSGTFRRDSLLDHFYMWLDRVFGVCLFLGWQKSPIIKPFSISRNTDKMIEHISITLIIQQCAKGFIDVQSVYFVLCDRCCNWEVMYYLVGRLTEWLMPRPN